MQKTYAGKSVEVDGEGYLVSADDWSEEVAKEIAKELNIEMPDGGKHWEVLRWLREQHEGGVEMSIRKVGGSGVVDIKEFYQLFPGGPLKHASKIAGLKRPTSCV